MQWGEAKSDLAEEKRFLEVLIEDPGVINLAKTIKEDYPKLCNLTVELLDNLFLHDAEKHFRAVDTLWRDGDFFELLCKEFIQNHQLDDYLRSCINDTREDLHELRGYDVRKDPELKVVLEMREPAARIRGALSILIGYWCLEYKLEDYFTGDLGLYGLGIENISFANIDCKCPLPLVDPWISQKTMSGEMKMFTNTAVKRAGDPNALAMEERDFKRIAKTKSSIIGQLINVPTVSCLAEKIINDYPGIVEVAEEFLKSLEDKNFERSSDPRSFYYFPPNIVPGSVDYVSLKLHQLHRFAMREFWRNVDFCELLLRHIIEDPCMLAIVKIFSYRSTREIALLRSEYILQFYENEPFFTNPKCDLEHKTRLALAILFEHWTSMPVHTEVRKRLKYDYSHKETTKKYAGFKDEPIGEVIFRPCVGAGIHNDPVSAAYDMTDLRYLLTHWNEENQTEINHLLEKPQDLSYVLTGEYKADETMINGLLEKINSVRADSRSRMRMELKNVPGSGLSMTCSF